MCLGNTYKFLFSVNASARGGGLHPPPPPPLKVHVFSQNKDKFLECSEAKEYAKILCWCLQWYPLSFETKVV